MTSSSEPFSYKDSEGIKIEPPYDETKIKIEIEETFVTYDSQETFGTVKKEETFGGDTCIPTSCDDQAPESPITFGCSNTIASNSMLQKADSLDDGFCQKTTTASGGSYSDELYPYVPNDTHNLKKRNLFRKGEPLPSSEHCDTNNIAKHMLSEITEKPHSSQLCSYETHYDKALASINLGKNYFSCELCSFKTDLKTQFRKEKTLSCDFCSYEAKHQSTLMKHILIHSEKKFFSCKLCSYKTHWEANLKTHLLIHTGEKPFSCKFCSFKTGYKLNLKKHILVHIKKPFSCKFCSFKTNRRSFIKKHILTHTTEKPFSCDLCSFKTEWEANLKGHILTHTEKEHFSV